MMTLQVLPLLILPLTSVVLSIDYTHDQVQYQSVSTDKGTYNFGYDTGLFGAHSFHQQWKGENGEVKGRYGYTDPNGLLRIVEYTAGKNGYYAKEKVEPGNPVRPGPRPPPGSNDIIVTPGFKETQPDKKESLPAPPTSTTSKYITEPERERIRSRPYYTTSRYTPYDRYYPYYDRYYPYERYTTYRYYPYDRYTVPNYRKKVAYSPPPHNHPHPHTHTHTTPHPHTHTTPHPHTHTTPHPHTHATPHPHTHSTPHPHTHTPTVTRTSYPHTHTVTSRPYYERQTVDTTPHNHPHYTTEFERVYYRDKDGNVLTRYVPKRRYYNSSPVSVTRRTGEDPHQHYTGPVKVSTAYTVCSRHGCYDSDKSPSGVTFRPRYTRSTPFIELFNTRPMSPIPLLTPIPEGRQLSVPSDVTLEADGSSPVGLSTTPEDFEDAVPEEDDTTGSAIDSFVTDEISEFTDTPKNISTVDDASTPDTSVPELPITRDSTPFGVTRAGDESFVPETDTQPELNEILPPLVTGSFPFSDITIPMVSDPVSPPVSEYTDTEPQDAGSTTPLEQLSTTSADFGVTAAQLDSTTETKSTGDSSSRVDNVTATGTTATDPLETQSTKEAETATQSKSTTAYSDSTTLGKSLSETTSSDSTTQMNENSTQTTETLSTSTTAKEETASASTTKAP